jgi:HD-like signal output (HDOD) protein
MSTDLDALSREAEKIVKSIGFPPCPAILAKLVREMRNDDPDFAKLGALIGSDVGLAAALLKTVNSPFYGLRTKATSIRQALTLLGLRNITQLITGLLLRQAFPVGANAGMEEFWEYSAGIAQASLYLGRRVRGIDTDLAYTFALFRDCGIPAMIGAYTEYVPAYTFRGAADGRTVIDLEEENFGIHHAYMGYHLAKEWLLPESVCKAVLCHHDYAALQEGRADIPASGTKLIALALAGEWLYSRRAMVVECGEWRQYGAFALDTLGVSQADLEATGAELDGALEGGT